MGERADVMHVRRLRLAFVALSALVSVSATAPSAIAGGGSSQTVTRFDDPVDDSNCQPNDCSLRQAVNAAGAGGALTINLAAGVYQLSAGFGALQVGASQILIVGQGAGKTFVDNGDSGQPAFLVSSPLAALVGLTVNGVANSQHPATVIVNHGELTLKGDQIQGGNGPDGGVVNEAVGQLAGLSVQDSTIAGNIASRSSGAGGIHNLGSPGGPALLTVLDSTIAGNNAPRFGGILSDGSSGNTVTVGFSTIAVNHASSAGASGVGIAGTAGAVYVKDSIVAANSNANPSSVNNCVGLPGMFVSQGHNLQDTRDCGFHTSTDITAPAKLGPLQDNGGGVLTTLPASGSPAIDGAGHDCPPPAHDERAVPRPQPAGGLCDIGAVERDLAHEPAVVTGFASDVHASTATLTGTIDSKGQAASYHFVLVTQSPLTQTSTPTQTLPAGAGPRQVAVPVTGLDPSTNYAYYLTAQNASGSGSGASRTFTTSKSFVSVPTGPVTHVTAPLYVQSSWNYGGTGLGQFVAPSGIAIDHAGDVWITDPGLGRVDEFTSDGAFIKSINCLSCTGAVAALSGDRLALGTASDDIRGGPGIAVLSAAGTLVSSSPADGVVTAIAPAPDGKLIVTTSASVSRINSDGSDVRQIDAVTPPRCANPCLGLLVGRAPTAAVTDSSGNVFEGVDGTLGVNLSAVATSIDELSPSEVDASGRPLHWAGVSSWATGYNPYAALFQREPEWTNGLAISPAGPDKGYIVGLLSDGSLLQISPRGDQTRTNPAALSSAASFAFDCVGNIYIAVPAESRIVKIVRDAAFPDCRSAADKALHQKQLGPVQLQSDVAPAGRAGTVVACPFSACTGTVAVLDGQQQLKAATVAVALPAGRLLGKVRYRIKGGFSKTILISLSPRGRALLARRHVLKALIVALPDGSRRAVVQRVTLRLPSSLRLTCPASGRVGRAITVRGKLAPARSHTPTAVFVLGQSPIGAAPVILRRSARARANGSVSVSFTPTQAGRWTVYVDWPGDPTHEPASARSCALAVRG